MLKKVFIFGILLLLLPVTVAAQGDIRVGVAPFTIFSQEDLGYLSQGVQEMISNHLLQQGIVVAPQTDMIQALGKLAGDKMDDPSAQAVGRALNLDYVIYGSLTKVGRLISLDARVVDPTGLKKTQAVFIQDEGLENVMNTSQKLVQEITSKISGRQKIAEIAISGNERIEPDAIKRALQSQEGDLFSEAKLSEDLKRVYALNFFDDVQVDVKDSPEGKIVTFIVEEKPSIQRIVFEGNKMLEQEDLLSALGYNLYAIVDEEKLLESVDNLKGLYREKGYYNAEIEHRVETIGPKRVAVHYDINEHGRVYIRNIRFEGNEAFSDGDLADEMQTSEKGFFFLADRFRSPQAGQVAPGSGYSVGFLSGQRIPARQGRRTGCTD